MTYAKTCRSKYCVKESQSLARILDTLVYAMEFISIPTPAEQAEGLEDLRKTVLRIQPDLKVSAHCVLIAVAHAGNDESMIWLRTEPAVCTIARQGRLTDFARSMKQA